MIFILVLSDGEQKFLYHGTDPQLQWLLAVAMIRMTMTTAKGLYWVPLCYYYLEEAGGSK